MNVKGDLRRRVSEGGPFSVVAAQGKEAHLLNVGIQGSRRERRQPEANQGGPRGSLASGALPRMTQVSTVNQIVHQSLGLGW